MTNPIRKQYFEAVQEFERSYISAHADDSITTQAIWDKFARQYKDLHSLYNQMAPTLLTTYEKDQYAHMQKQVNGLYILPNRVNYLRVALENNLWRLAHKYFGEMPKEKMDQAFELLCRAHGRPTNTNDTVEDGIHHVAYNPEKLLDRAMHLPLAPRIIDVLLEGTFPGQPTKPTTAKLKSSDLLTFHQGANLAYVFAQGEPQLMKNDEDIRWLFPLEQDVDDPSFCDKFKKDIWCKGNLKTAFEQMLKIYGFELDEKAIRTVKPTKGQPFLWLLSQYKHWQNHIERILKCMVAMNTTDSNFHTYASHFAAALEDVAKGKGNDIDPAKRETWQKAVNVAPLASEKTIAKIDAQSLLLFYIQDSENPYKTTHNQYCLKSDFFSLKEEEFRWLFPLAEDVEDPSFVDKFKAHATCVSALTIAFRAYLKNCGLEMDQGILRRIQSPFFTMTSCWNTPNATLHEQVERILKCLTQMGLVYTASNFLLLLKQIKENEGKAAISDATLKAWEKAVPQY